MTREDSIASKTWVTNDGRYLNVAEITDDHLLALQAYLREAQSAGRDAGADQATLAIWMADHAEGKIAPDEEMKLDVFRSGWLQIVAAEIAARPHLPQARG